MKINKLSLLALLGVFILNSCSNDDDVSEPLPIPEGDYTDGFFVLNEGNFGANNSTLSYVNYNLSTINNDVFNQVNGTSLGDTAQSLIFDDDLAYVVLNASNSIEIFNRYTLEKVGTIDENLSNPRYSAIENDRLYVTNWGDGTIATDDYVAVFDLNTLEFITTISVEEGPEKIISEDDKLYVALQGGFSFNDKVVVIDANSNKVLSTITVGDVPSALEVEDDFLWVNSSGLPSYSGSETAGAIYKININTNEVVVYEFDDSSQHPSNLEIEDNMVYFTLGGSVYRFNTSATELPTASQFELSEITSLYGFEVEDNYIYAADALNYTQGGKVVVYDLNGEVIADFTSGIAPSGFYFN